MERLKITLEIENDTGVEFEDRAEWRLVRKGAINPEYISPLDYEWLDEGGE